jgi:hypothetical protein
LRISTISNFASPNAGGVIVGRYYDNAFQGSPSGVLVLGSNLLHLAPFYTSQTMRIDQLGAAVSTAQAGGLFRCCIYEANAEGWPDALIYEGDANLTTDTTGYKSHTVDILFDAGRQYWVGCVALAITGRIRSINAASAVNLGLTSSTASSYATVLRITHTFANALPNPWVFAPAHLVANVTPPSIRMRAAIV